MYNKKDVHKLQDDSLIPIEIIGDLDITEKKAKVLDILSAYKSQTFLVFTVYPENDKANLETYQLKDIVNNINIIYGIIPISLETYREIIDNAL